MPRSVTKTAESHRKQSKGTTRQKHADAPRKHRTRGPGRGVIGRSKKAVIARGTAIQVPEPSADDLPELAAKINAEHEKAEAGFRTGIVHAREAGRLLNSAKERIQHGDWQPWLKTNCKRLSARTAQAYMRIALRWEELEAKAQTTAGLTIDRALSLLAHAWDRAEQPLPSALQLTEHKGGLFDATALAKHLSHLAIGGMISEVRVKGAFQGQAVRLPEGNVMAFADGVASGYGLEREIGIPDVRKLIRLLNHAGSEKSDVGVTIEGDRLVVDERSGPKHRLKVLDPNATTHLPGAERIERALPGVDWIPLTVRARNGIVGAHYVHKTKTIRFTLGEQLVCTIGEITDDVTVVNVGDVEHVPEARVETEFEAEAVVAALKQITDFTGGSEIGLVNFGPGLLGIRQLGYTYLIAPHGTASSDTGEQSSQ